jgi:hypothetical protein
MRWISLGWFARVGLVPVLLSLAVGAAGCSVSACAGSGCDNGKITFGSNIKQNSKDGTLSLVGKTGTFTLGRSLAMLAILSENAGSKSLTLDVSHSGKHRSIPYSVHSKGSNELAHLFNAADLNVVGITTAGSYNFRILRGSKVLAKGSMTEK